MDHPNDMDGILQKWTIESQGETGHLFLLRDGNWAILRQAQWIERSETKDAPVVQTLQLGDRTFQVVEVNGDWKLVDGFQVIEGGN